MTKQKKYDWDDIFPNTPEGAIECLKVQSTYNVKGANAIPDPAVDGVWLIKMDPKLNEYGHEAVVYMKGYRESFGEIREINDFEEVENATLDNGERGLSWLF